MNTNNFCISITFDQNYVEPALLTVYELISSGVKYPIILIYIENNDKLINNEVEIILSRFKNLFINIDLSVIKINDNGLKQINKFHFTNAILFKVLVPSIIDYDFILNIDAGFLLGCKSNELLDQISLNINNKMYDDSIVAAFCSESNVNLHSTLRQYPHNSKYPAGGFLLFNSKKYKLNNIYNKIMTKYIELWDLLIYAEQDLLCIIMEENQLSQLPMQDLIVIEYLDLHGLEKNIPSVGSQVDEFAFYKVCGTCKPWKYWVLDYRKSFYLKRRDNFEKIFCIFNYEVIKKNRHHVTHQPLAQKFLEQFENILRQL